MLTRFSYPCTVAIIALLAAPYAFAVKVPLSGEQPVAGAPVDTARGVRFADFDRDGDMDVVGAEQTSGIVTWYENTAGDGSAYTPHGIDNNFGNLTFLTVADVDGDGFTDVLASRLSTNVGQDSVVWYRNDGTPANDSSWVLQQIATGLLGPLQFAVGDIDRDGDQDVVIAHTGQTLNPIGQEILWYEQTPLKGSGWTPRIVDASIPVPNSVAVGDINGDGFLDIIAGSGATMAGAIFWYPNDGEPALAASWAEFPVDSAFDQPRFISVADMDRDGINDVLAAGGDADEIAWWRNPGNEVFAKQSIDTLTEASIAIAFDFDGDGDIDVVGGSDNAETNPADDTVAWWENTNGLATAWTERTIIGGTFNRLSSASIGDADGDGDPDLVIAGFAADSVTRIENLTIHRATDFARTDSASSAASAGVAIGDFDGDGRPDIAAGGVAGDGISWFRNDGPTPAWNATTVADNLAGAGPVAAGDIDGDGAVDIASAASGANRISFWRNSAGNGSNWTETIVDNNLTGASAIAIGDMDKDGYLDIFAGGGGSGAINFYENRTNLIEGFTLHSAATGFNGVSAVTIADINGDGDPDGAGVSPNSNTVRWWESDGTPGNPGSFTQRDVNTSLTGARAIAAGDVDRDGTIDLVAVGATATVLYRNTNGNGQSWTPVTIANFGGRGVVLRDLDCDGDLDVAMADTVASILRTFENNGNGTSWTITSDPLSVSGVAGVVAGDIDRDGRFDLASAGSAGTGFHANGGGQFTLDTVAPTITGDDDGGTVAALRIDAAHSGRTGDNGVQLVTLDIAFTTNDGTALTSGQANALISRAFIAVDNGNDAFESAQDTELVSVMPLSLDGNGATQFALPANANTQIAAGGSRSYFVVTVLTADASSQTPGSFRVVHRTASTSTAQDQTDSEIPLRLTFAANTSSGLLAPGGDPADINGDGNINASDIQLVINAVLGLPITGNADVNGDSMVNSTDIQLTINAVLGI